MPFKDFPNDVAHINDSFIFTTLTTKQVEAHAKSPYRHPKSGLECFLFSLDDQVQYIPFAKDYGPLNLAFTFEACCALYDKLHAKSGRPICLYTSPDPKMKSNMALMAALYCVIVGHNSASEAFRPFAEMEMLPFRDAGNAVNDFGLSIQDCLYGVEKAIDCELLSLSTFDCDRYRFFETVANGDMNVLGPFIPFASPVDKLWVLEELAKREPTRANLTALAAEQAIQRNTPKSRFPNRAFRCIMKVFKEESVGVVVRLNNDLYDRNFFLQAGISHIDMYFDDGSNPTDEIVRAFIRLAEETIEKQNMRVAVHCKAGLGRTGVLIGAYFIYKYGFSAHEVIGFMRLVRPGMVVGPQQQYMVENQMKWVGWAARDAMLRELKISSSQQSAFELHTPPLETEPPLPHPETSSPRYNEPVQELKLSTRHRRIVSASLGDVTTKAGDAVGQPRKGTGPVRPDSIIEVDEEVEAVPQEEEVQFVSSRTIYRDHSSSSSAPSASRGVKRGAGRVPVDRTSSSNRLDVPSSTLARSTSTTSMQSTATDIDDRVHKRRPAMATSSPVPSRDVSPRPHQRLDTTVAESRTTSTQALSPSRNRVNVVKAPVEVAVDIKSLPPARPSRNGAEMIRPSREDLQSQIPVPSPSASKRILLKTRKSPPAEDVVVVPAAPELARTKPSSREGTLARAGHVETREREKEIKAEKEKEKKVASPPRFGARLLSRFGAA